MIVGTYKDWRTAWHSYISNDDGDEIMLEFVPNDTQAAFMASKFGTGPVRLWYGTGDALPEVGSLMTEVVTGDQRLSIHEGGVVLHYDSGPGAVFLPASLEEV
jgi:hypothetical protein